MPDVERVSSDWPRFWVTYRQTASGVEQAILGCRMENNTPYRWRMSIFGPTFQGGVLSLRVEPGQSNAITGVNVPTSASSDKFGVGLEYAGSPPSAS